MFEYALEMFEGLAKLPDVTKADTSAGVYAWYFPECQKGTLIPVYIGQSKNIYNRCHHHHLNLNRLYSRPPALGEEFRPPRHFDTYDSLRALLSIAGISDRPKERFKILEHVEDATAEKLMEKEQFYIISYYSNIFGFNSPVPLELLFHSDREYLEGLWSFLWKSLEYLDESTLIGKVQKGHIEAYGLKRIDEYLKGSG